LRYHNTLITKLPEDKLGKNMHQRLRIGLDHKGPNINFYSRFTMFDIVSFSQVDSCSLLNGHSVL
jgi:hypothetical protein